MNSTAVGLQLTSIRTSVQIAMEKTNNWIISPLIHHIWHRKEGEEGGRLQHLWS